jgi:hypothetical protein
MLAGMLVPSGLDIGDDYILPNDANPKGFFEDHEVNSINGEILERVLPKKWNVFDPRHKEALRSGQHWLAQVPLEKRLPATPKIVHRITKRKPDHPFAFKDPRFSYTLPVWRPHVGNAAFICIFREPSRTANSIVRECNSAPYLKNVSMNYDKALSIWTLMYKHVLERHRFEGDWLFVHYEDVLNGTARPRIEKLLGVEINQSFVSTSLRRSSSEGKLTPDSVETYKQLCELAQYEDTFLKANPSAN